MFFDELDEMSQKKLVLSIFYGTMSGVIAAWLVSKFLERKGCGPKGAREEIREVEDERDDRDNPADILLKKMVKDSRGKLKNTRRDMIKVGVHIIILFEIPHHPSAVDANISRIF